MNQDKERILVVDDDQIIRKSLRNFLQDFLGYDVEEAEDGIKALEKLAANSNFDFILTDGNMPRMDGFEMIKKIKEILGLTIPIILISGLESKEQEGMKDYFLKKDYIMAFLPKPFDLKILKKLFSKKSSE